MQFVFQINSFEPSYSKSDPCCASFKNAARPRAPLCIKRGRRAIQTKLLPATTKKDFNFQPIFRRMSENRQRQHKFAGKKDIARANRRDVAIQLRKEAREDQMSKRRNLTEDSNASPMKSKSPDRPREDANLPSQMEDIKRMIVSELPTDIRRSVKAVRKMLSASGDPPINYILSQGLCEPLVKHLYSKCGVTQTEAAWALTNISCGDSSQTLAVVNAGGIPGLTHVFDSNSVDAVEQAIWALSNIAGDGCHLRDQVLADGVVHKVMRHIVSERTGDFLPNLTWMLSNLCRNKPAPALSLIEPLIKPLSALLAWSDKKCNIDSAWAFSYFTDAGDDHVKAIAKVPGTYEQLMRLASSNDKKLVVPSLRALGNVVSGDDKNTEYLLNQGFLKLMIHLLETCTAQSIIKDACWAVSNVAAGTVKQTKAVCEEPNLLELVVSQLHSGDFKTQKECGWVFANICMTGSTDEYNRILATDAVHAMRHLLKCSDIAMIELALEFYEKLLNFARLHGKEQQLTDDMEECDVLDDIEELQTHETMKIYALSVQIIEKFFITETNDGETMEAFTFKAPLQESNQPFSF